MQIVKNHSYTIGTKISASQFRLSSRFTLNFLVLIAAATFGLIGCTADQISNYARLVEPQADAASTGDAASTYEIDSAAANRLLVLQADGNVVTMTPDGEDLVQITDDATGTNVVYQQPTWSPDGSYIAWTRTVSNRGNSQSTLQIVDHLGKQQRELQLPFAPFYYYWSPDGDNLAYLSNWVYQNMGAMALRIVETSAEKLSSKTLALGQPSYFSWAPDSRQIVTHIGDQLTSVRSLDGTILTLSDESSGFSAPQWVADGENLLYAISSSGDQSLILTELDGSQIQEVTTYKDRITFSVSSTSKYFAYTTVDPANRENSASGLYVTEIESLRTRELSSNPSLGFIWSPDGEKLAYMVLEGSGRSSKIRWYVWDAVERSTKQYDSFVPSRTFLQTYLPFFDQYVQSMTLWSPDSSAFTYAGSGVDGGSSVWVQTLSEESAVEVGDGVFVAWSPQ